MTRDITLAIRAIRAIHAIQATQDRPHHCESSETGASTVMSQS